ncbi:MAG: ATPase, T2SS/T4P/T4SS family [Thermodesulfobacteriota bacterium]|nr:ATPase, T2SS/T4P/T4SS family [Thermodesulfobacteriota bacterium]
MEQKKIMDPVEKKEEDKSYDICRFLLEEGVIDKDQLKRAQRIHSKLEEKKRLSDVLVQLGYVYESQIKEVMKKHKRHLRLGDFLIEMKFITNDQLKKALKLQKTENKRLGDVLVDAGMINELNLCKALSEQMDCPFIEPDLRIIDKKLLRQISVRYMKQHQFIPFSRDNNGVIVIFKDPMDKDAIKAAREAFGDNIIPAISTKSNIVESLDGYESGTHKVEDFQIQGKKGEQDIVRLVDYILQSAIDDDASDIHIEPLAKKTRVRFRKDGVLVQKTEFPKHLHDMITSRLKIMAGADIANKRHHQDGKIEYTYYSQKIDIRFSSYVTVNGENIVMRLLSKKKGLNDLRDLGFAQGTLKMYIDEVLMPTSGVVIITGPTGSGKTTTLYSSIDYCNDPSIKIITAEDPVEYIIDGIIQCSINDYIGLSFKETLKAIVRQDPDIVVLGEMRDKYSAEVAVEAALTGHKVFTTFHTEDSIGGIIRLMNMDIETFMISSTVLSIVAQRLLRKVCPFCKESYTPEPREILKVGLNPEDIEGYDLCKGAGCRHCNYTGYTGRIGVYEILVLNEPIKDAILEKKTSYQIRKISLEHTGMVSLLEDAIIKVLKGETTFEEVIKHVPYTHRPRPIEEIMKMVEH